jgi:hypothetical protein
MGGALLRFNFRKAIPEIDQHEESAFFSLTVYQACEAEAGWIAVTDVGKRSRRAK